MQSIVTPLESVLTGYTRKIRVKVRASWLKVADLSTVYAIVGSSLVDGPNLVQGQSTIITNSDLFSYMDESAHAMRIDYDRKIDEPRGGTFHAIADVLLDNIGGRFTPLKNATIGTAIEARRPFKVSIGFDAGGVDRMVQVIVGLTAERPRLSRSARQVEIQVYDYITFIDNANLEAAIYEDMRTDEIIESILVDLGFGSSQYMLDVGINTIPFAWFDKDKRAGVRIRELCESEEARFYQDENGILRFENRNHWANYPHQTTVRTIDSGDILSDEDDVSTKIINRAIVIAKPRKVDAATGDIWSLQGNPSILPGQSLTVWAAFFDTQGGQNKLPVSEITTPASGTDYAGNTLANGTGTDRTASLSVAVTNFVESAKIVITNNHGSDTVFLTLDVANSIGMKLRGKAARVTQAIQAVVEDADSINKFEPQEHTLGNDLIQTREIAETIATNLVNKYKDPMSRRIIRIPGIPHLQLGDLLNVVNPEPENLITNPSFEVTTTYWSVETTGSVVAPLTRARDIPIEDGFFAGKITIS